MIKQILKLLIPEGPIFVALPFSLQFIAIAAFNNFYFKLSLNDLPLEHQVSSIIGAFVGSYIFPCGERTFSFTAHLYNQSKALKISS